MLKSILVANRGEIAVRILKTAKSLGVKTVAVYSEADSKAPHALLADVSVCVGPAPVAESYLNKGAIINAAIEHGVEGIHPGYGLLSENFEFAESCEAEGIRFIGPSPFQLTQFGLKHTARELAEEAGVPLVPGTGILDDCDNALIEAELIGYPVMLKSTAGGGGIGMQVCNSDTELSAVFEQVKHLGEVNFGHASVFLEKFIPRARHLEVQIFGDGEGECLALGVRDCSTQRRNQKIIEETPVFGVDESVLDEMKESAKKLAGSVHYRSAGTVEFIYDVNEGKYYFLEVNTRLQVEHAVTEEVIGIDLVEWMIRLASGEKEFIAYPEECPGGHSIEARIYAENPLKDFQPSSGELSEVFLPEGVRCDHWIEAGTVVTPYYDPLLAKVIVHAPTRDEALKALGKALAETLVYGIETNLEYLNALVDSPLLSKCEITTTALKDFNFKSATIEIIRPGTQSTIQDHPGRLGYWGVGVPPSGPMDALSFRYANRLLANDASAAALEITAHGPLLEFNQATVICLCGAEAKVTLNGKEISYWGPLPVESGDRLDIGIISGAGMRAYLAVAGGFKVPGYLGSLSTFTLGKFGGHAGRALQAGDFLHISSDFDTVESKPLPESLRPVISNHWEIKVLYGPHGAPEFFTQDDIDVFLETDWEVHFNSSRTGVRLLGPAPKWARKDGGEAGLHPSNIHDNAYAVGAVDFTGDMPIILGVDGPSLGGFVCPVIIASVDLWKAGQLKPGDKVRFVCVSEDDASALMDEQEAKLNTLTEQSPVSFEISVPQREDAVLFEGGVEEERWVIRAVGDNYILIEFGPIKIDIALRFAVHVLHEYLIQNMLTGVIDMTPGVRSLQLHYDCLRVSRKEILEWVLGARNQMGSLDDQTVPSRIVYLPLSWNDSSTQLAVNRYMESVRQDAPWCPDNIEFVRRINGLESADTVRNIVYDASYVVLGLGDVYLGAPVATPLDPRHRLVTTKYNPARTWTAENSVGLGGMFMCIYGMESPGGYQLVGRTLQVWNRYDTTPYFQGDKRWLLRFFDQIRYFPVSPEELVQIRHDFPKGHYPLRIEEVEFSLAEHKAMLANNAQDIKSFRSKQQSAFNEERAQWDSSDQKPNEAAVDEVGTEAIALKPGLNPVDSVVAGSVYKILVSEGDIVEAGQEVVIIESMKMEVKIECPVDGSVDTLLCKVGQAVRTGDTLMGVSSDS